MSEFKTKLNEACKTAKDNLAQAQSKMKSWYDKRAREQVFKESEKVLLLLPKPGSPLQAKFSGPYTVLKKLNSVDYVISTPDRRKTKRVCHVNMINPYHEREPVVAVSCLKLAGPVEAEEKGVDLVEEYLAKMALTPIRNSEVVADLDSKLAHLTELQKQDIMDLIQEHRDSFGDVPSRTTVMEHDIVLQEGATPVKQHPYRLNPSKAAALRKEIQYMLDNDLIEPSESPWSSPVLLVPKPDSTFRMCIDFRSE